MSDFSETFGSVRDTDRKSAPRKRRAQRKPDPLVAKFVEATRMLMRAASPYMTHRNYAEREAYAKLREAMQEATGEES